MENAYSRRICGEKSRNNRLKRPLVIAIPLSLFCVFLYPYIEVLRRPFCVVKIFTGIDCPGCGMIRSVALLLHGDIAGSFRLHPLGVVVVVAMIYVWIKNLLCERIEIPKSLQVGFVALLMLVWIWRMI